MKQKLPIPPKLKRILHRIYGLPASITIVSGKWKTGKTDFSLLLTEYLEQEGIIKQFASNIETQNSKVQFINDFAHLDLWLYQNKMRKMFLYDELIESSPRRTAMSSMNVGWLKRIPQLSKGRCHLIVIAQDVNMADSIFVNANFVRGGWQKLNKTTVRFRSGYLNKRITFFNIPKSSIKFDPYLLATFRQDNPELQFDMLPLPFKVARLIADGKRGPAIAKELKIETRNPRESVHRLIVQLCKAICVTMSESTTEGKKLIEAADKAT